MQAKQQDVMIVGAGLVGAAMAIALAQAGLRVALIEAMPPKDSLKQGFDGRVSAIAKGSQLILDSIGVWQHIDDFGPILDIRVCDEKGRHYVHYDHRNAGDEPFGYMVENRMLRVALDVVQRQQENITLYQPATVQMVAERAGMRHITLSTGEAIEASLLLVADGKFSATRTLLGIGARTFGYGHTAIVCTIRHTLPHKGLALEKFRAAGPFAVLPMSGNRSNIVWAEPHELAERILTLSEAEILAELRMRMGDELGEIELTGPCHSYPLMLILAERCIASRTVLIGDAAHGIHPVAGQGANLGYRDVAVLAQLIIEQARLGLDIGSNALLHRYRAMRRFDTYSMSAFTDGITRLFSNDSVVLRLARDAGLGAVEQLEPLKRHLMKHAMGMAGELPRMMRGEAA